MKSVWPIKMGMQLWPLIIYGRSFFSPCNFATFCHAVQRPPWTPRHRAPA